MPGRFKEHLSFCGWPRRRLALLQWALEEAAWIVEDDYDSEYRYSGRPVAALQGLEVGALSRFAVKHRPTNGLMLGFAVCNEAEIRRGVDVLAEALIGVGGR